MFSINNANNEENVHGGFKDVVTSEEFNHQSKVISGTSRENINAVLPLYISEEHWRVSRQKDEASFRICHYFGCNGLSFRPIQNYSISSLQASPRML